MSHLAKLPTVLMVSAYGQDEIRTRAAAAGISAFLVKPVEPAMLLETIRALMGTDKSCVPVHVPPSEEVPQVAPRLRGLRVLVAEDNEINRELAVELLTDAGLVVAVAENGRVACERVLDRGEHFDAILMDVQMPEMDGLEATTRIRQHRTRDLLPIIAMTAHAYDAEQQRCLDAGMNDHVAKPVDPAALIRTLDHWLTPRRPKDSVPPPTGATSHPIIGELPASLPPFDLDAALKRTNGKSALLKKLIINFGDQYSATMLTLRAQIAAASYDEARRLAHTLKGVAGSLEIRAVAEAATQVEDVLSDRDLSKTDGCLDRLEQAMLPALAASVGLKEGVAPPMTKNMTVVDYTALAPMITELRELLRRRSFRARLAFELLEQSPGISAALHPVKTALAKLDYDEALSVLDGILDPDEIPGWRLGAKEIVQ
jgi:CheY-like chemotaxis protein/HPt (histidine-containing phosphotransfer) domain-containing protein